MYFGVSESVNNSSRNGKKVHVVGSAFGRILDVGSNIKGSTLMELTIKKMGERVCYWSPKTEGEPKLSAPSPPEGVEQRPMEQRSAVQSKLQEYWS